MAVEITIPRLGWNMEEGIFAGWLKRDGDAIRAGESVFSLESEKATQDIECLDSGVLRIPPNAPKEGDTLAVGTVIAYLVQAGEPAPFERKSAESVGVKATQLEQKPESSGSDAESTTIASRKQVGASGGDTVDRPDPAISPRARRLAAELGVDWIHLEGSGSTGRIREKDVRAAVGTNRTTRQPAKSSINPVRRTIAARMLESHRSTAPVTLTTTADATNLVNLRNQFKASTPADAVAPSYTDFIVKLTAVALRDHPYLNARWADDRVVLVPSIDIGVAVDTPAGLYVPVLHDVPNLNIQELAARSSELIERARERKLRVEEMQGSSFTITNLGPFGIDAFTPIINFPECAILGIGRITRHPVVHEEKIAIRDQITLSLTFDHRVVDGAPAAQFLHFLSQLIENPGPFLIV